MFSDETHYVWDPEWSHPSFINIPTDISSLATITISINKDYVRITPLTIDATPINCNLIITDREGNNSLNSTFINQENLNGTKNLTKQDFQAPSHFHYTTKFFSYSSNTYNPKKLKNKSISTNNNRHL